MIKVNAIGDVCPIPVVKTKKAMQELDGVGVIEVLVDNEIAVANVSKMAASAGAKAASDRWQRKSTRLQLKWTEVRAHVTRVRKRIWW